MKRLAFLLLPLALTACGQSKLSSKQAAEVIAGYDGPDVKACREMTGVAKGKDNSYGSISEGKNSIPQISKSWAALEQRGYVTLKTVDLGFTKRIAAHPTDKYLQDFGEPQGGFISNICYGRYAVTNVASVEQQDKLATVTAETTLQDIPAWVNDKELLAASFSPVPVPDQKLMKFTLIQGEDGQWKVQSAKSAE